MLMTLLLPGAVAIRLVSGSPPSPDVGALFLDGAQRSQAGDVWQSAVSAQAADHGRQNSPSSVKQPSAPAPNNDQFRNKNQAGRKSWPPCTGGDDLKGCN